jgi:hypothetical protein
LEHLRLQKSINKRVSCLTTRVISTADHEKLSPENQKVIKKFDEFLRSSSKRSAVKTDRLAKTMRKYVNQELTGRSDKSKKLTQYDMNVYFKLNLIKELQSERGHSRREIRKMLHPTLPEDQLPEETDSIANKHIHLNTLFSNRNKLKVNPKFFSRFKEFAKLPPSDFDTPIIRNSSPYVTEQEQQRKEYMKSKQGWINDRPFKTFFNKATKADNFIPNYVTMTPSDPPILHKFRSTKKEEWIAHDFKF